MTYLRSAGVLEGAGLCLRLTVFMCVSVCPGAGARAVPQPAGAVEGAGVSAGERGGPGALLGRRGRPPPNRVLEPHLVLPPPGSAQLPAPAHPQLAALSPRRPGE